MQSEKKSENNRSWDKKDFLKDNRPGTPIPPENDESVPDYAHEVLTGGHGGSIPAFIVRLIRNIFNRNS
ncbi:MAG: hypothetical protein HXS53_11860 [Theionarchaea archaeon]|nr:hypothetical protein [Theionarchaea archaeon]